MLKIRQSFQKSIVQIVQIFFFEIKIKAWVMIIDWGVLIKNLKSQVIFEQLIQKIFQEKSHLFSTIFWQR